jgi:hypothetical protein
VGWQSCRPTCMLGACVTERCITLFKRHEAVHLLLCSSSRLVAGCDTRLLGRQVSGATVLSHDLFTNDVLYAEVALNLRPVPTRLLPLVPLFCRCAACALAALRTAGFQDLGKAGRVFSVCDQGHASSVRTHGQARVEYTGG